jgi:enterochelin esterase-like enzyme
MPDDKDHAWVTFLYRGDNKTRGVALKGGMPAAAEFNHLRRLPGTHLWFQTQRLPKDARFTYFFILDPPLFELRDRNEAKQVFARLRLDPLNPRRVGGRPLVELPDAPPQPFLEAPADLPRGRRQEHTLASAILKQKRSFTVVTPPGYDPQGELCTVLILFDGRGYETDIPAPIILDHLLALKKIPSTLAVLVHQQDRLRELMCSESFADFVAKELTPWIRSHYRVKDDPAHTIIGGLSAGGLMAAYCGLRHPDVFGNVLAQSGSFWYVPGAMDMTGRPRPYAESGWLTRRFVEAPLRPVRFYLEVGRFEASASANQVTEARRLRDVLQAKGYRVIYSEYSGGHDPVNWRGSLADGLIALTSSFKD